MSYIANEKRYDNDIYSYCGKSGLKLPLISLGLWHNFNKCDDYSNMTDMITTAFDNGITHFDLANNYGRPYPGSAEENFGKILKDPLKNYRDEIVVSTKAGYYMWPGPYGDFGSRKHLISSLDASLKRMGIEYVDIFYHHRMDSKTPLEETMGTLRDIVKSGKALYVGLSNYDAQTLKKAVNILESMNIHPIIHQIRYSMMNRKVLNEAIVDSSLNSGMGIIAFSPLEQGILSNKYLNGIPENSRANKNDTFLDKDRLTPELISKISKLNEIASERGQTLSQMSIAWLLGVGRTTSVLTGASSPKQIKENIDALKNTNFSFEESQLIDKIIFDEV